MAELKVEELAKSVGQRVAEEIKKQYIKRTVLDEIRAEIEKSRYGLVSDGIDIALQIIDKYRTESEGK